MSLFEREFLRLESIEQPAHFLPVPSGRNDLGELEELGDGGGGPSHNHYRKPGPQQDTFLRRIGNLSVYLPRRLRPAGVGKR